VFLVAAALQTTRESVDKPLHPALTSVPAHGFMSKSNALTSKLCLVLLWWYIWLLVAWSDLQIDRDACFLHKASVVYMYCDACMTHMFDIVPSRCTHKYSLFTFLFFRRKGKAKKKEISSKACSFMHRSLAALYISLS